MIEQSDPQVLDALRAISAILGMSYYLDTILVVGVGSSNKDWVSDSDDILGWLYDKIFEHPTHDSVYADEKALDLHMFEWADKVTGLAKICASKSEATSEDNALYFVYCRWLSKTISHFLTWAQNHVSPSIFSPDQQVQWTKLETRLLEEIPKDERNWSDLTSRIDELASSWTHNTLNYVR